MNIVDIISATQEFKDRYKDSAEDTVKATSFWNSYNPNPHELLMKQQYHVLRERMFKLLRTCKKVDPEVYENIHKGHPYFFIGITSYRLGDYQTAISFFDAALSEDLTIQDEIERPTHLFFLLRGDDPRNAAMLDTQYVQTKVKRSIDYYNDDVTKNQDLHKITVQDLRDVFIKYVLRKKDDPGLRTLLTTFITFVVEWDFRNEHFDLGVKKGTSESLFMHLFRGCVLFESLLKRNPYPEPMHAEQEKSLGNLINYYQNKLHVKVSSDFKKVKTLGELLTELNTPSQLIEESILCSYWLRNTIGHSLAWDVRINQDAYQKLYNSVISACLHVINCLWRNPSKL
jgi:hypothetical protein